MIDLFSTKKVTKTAVYLVDVSKSEKHEYLQPLLLIEFSGVAALYNPSSKYIGEVCNTRMELENRLSRKNLQIKYIPKEEYRFCSSCQNFMQEGFYFAGDDSCYCSRGCMETQVDWNTYNHLYDSGQAYWTAWY